jgi:F420-dependent oxidoreductase-like protein
MDLRAFTEPQQGASYEQLLRVARTAEDAGYDAFFRSDHFQAMGSGPGVPGVPGPTDSWVTLGALARETSRIRLGTLVTSATFRHPGMLAVQVAQVDDMSGGRVELGLGSGWFEAEHASYGVPFPPLGERFDRLTEQLELITGLWSTPVGERYSFTGSHYTVTDSPALPKPVQSPLPIIIGGLGKQRTPALAARYAQEFNAVFTSVADTADLIGRVGSACTAIGRDPATMTWSLALAIACGKDDAQVAARAAAIGRDAEELAANGLAGTPAQVVEKLGRYAELGVSRFYLQFLDVDDLDHVEFVAAEVGSQLPGHTPTGTSPA